MKKKINENSISNDCTCLFFLTLSFSIFIVVASPSLYSSVGELCTLAGLVIYASIDSIRFEIWFRSIGVRPLNNLYSRFKGQLLKISAQFGSVSLPGFAITGKNTIVPLSLSFSYSLSISSTMMQNVRRSRRTLYFPQHFVLQLPPMNLHVHNLQTTVVALLIMNNIAPKNTLKYLKLCEVESKSLNLFYI